MAQVTSDGKAISVRAKYQLKDILKAIPGAWWVPERKIWTYPASPATMANIAKALAGTQWQGDETATRLLEEAQQNEHQRKAVLAATMFDDVPITNTKGWKHQLRAYWFAEKMRATMLAMDMGTGKSWVVISLIINKAYQKTLILCPRSVLSVWPDEFTRHAGAPVRVVSLNKGSIIERTQIAQTAIAQPGPTVIVMNYDAAREEPFRKFSLSQEWDLVVFDESQRIKTPGSKVSLYCSRLRDRSTHRMALTGTPMDHSPLDVYAQYRALDPGIFGTSYTRFKLRYAIMGGYGNYQVIGYQNHQELAEKFASISYQVKADDVLDLPDAVDVQRTCELSLESKIIYDSLKKNFIAEVKGGVLSATHALTRLLRLQQITSGHVTNDKGKLVEVGKHKQELLTETIADLPPNEPIVVFCRFTRDLANVHKIAAELDTTSLELSGARNELAEWQSGDARIIAVQIRAGSLGIKLVRARYAIYYSLGFSLSEYLQSRARLRRPGQHHTVTYIHLLAENTVDEQVYQALEKRQKVIEAILESVRREPTT